MMVNNPPAIVKLGNNIQNFKFYIEKPVSPTRFYHVESLYANNNNNNNAANKTLKTSNLISSASNGDSSAVNSIRRSDNDASPTKNSVVAATANRTVDGMNFNIYYLY